MVHSQALLVKGFERNTIKGATLLNAGPEVLGRMMSQSASVARLPVAPEQLLASDVYAFSIVVYEMLTRQHPWPLSSTCNQLYTRLMSGERPPIDDRKLAAINSNAQISVLYRCMVNGWSTAPEDRPTIVEIHDQLLSVRNLTTSTVATSVTRTNTVQTIRSAKQ